MKTNILVCVDKIWTNVEGYSRVVMSGAGNQKLFWDTHDSVKGFPEEDKCYIITSMRVKYDLPEKNIMYVSHVKMHEVDYD